MSKELKQVREGAVTMFQKGFPGSGSERSCFVGEDTTDESE